MTPALWMELHDWLSKIDAEAARWLDELQREGQTPLIRGSAPADLQEIKRCASHSAGRVKAHAEYLARPPQQGREVEDAVDGEEE